MKVSWEISKKYFLETARTLAPDKRILLNQRLARIALDVMAYFVPKNNGLDYDTQAEALIERKYHIPNDYLHLQKEAYDEILRIVANKIQLTPQEANTVKFLEQEVIGLAIPHLLKDYSESSEGIEEHKKPSLDVEDKIITSNIKTLWWFRAKSPKGTSNTCCYNCHKIFERHGTKKNSLYCTISENPDCCYARKEVSVRQKEEWAFIESGQKCTHCGRAVSYSLNRAENNSHNSKWFCLSNDNRRPKDCYQAYRKAEYRKHHNS